MTTITKMHLKGFKSFSKPLDLDFGDNFNCILGPNGSGKSNVMDALCFVLGKTSAKSMRAEKSANLIYNGGKTGSPMKEAEVSLFFSNKEKEFPLKTDEVKISRIVRQNGQSIYKINDEIRTRQQIIELLNTVKIDPYGYNIILQGDIIRFMEMHPEDRRLLIEDAAGISVYEDRKNKALSELDKVDKKLNNANIILTERKTYLKELKKERDQAIKYKELQEQIKNNKATYLTLQIKEREENRDKFNKQIQENKENIEKINVKAKEIETHISSLTKELEKTNNLIETKGEKEQILLQKDLELLRTDIVRDKTRIESCEHEIKKIQERSTQLILNLKEIENKISTLKKDKENLLSNLKQTQDKETQFLSDINNFKKTHGISQNKELDNIEKELESKQNLLYKLKEEHSSEQSSLYKLDLDIKKFDKILFTHDRFGLSDKQTELKQTINDLDKKRSEHSIISGRINTNRKDLTILHEKLAKLRAKQIYIKESASKNLAIDRILSLKHKGVYGTVSDLGSVSSKYSLALDIAAGGRINSLVVADDKVAADCIKILKEKRLGVATFLPLNKIKERSLPNISRLKNMNGVHGLATDLISFDKKFQNIFLYVFGPTLVIDNINIARKIGVGKARMVTLDGDLFELSGAIIGGFRRKREGSFKQKELDVDFLDIETKFNNFKETLQVLENNKIDLEKDIANLREKRAEFEGELIKFENSVGTQNLSKIQSQHKLLISEKQSLDKKLNNLTEQITNLIKDISVLKSSREKLKSESDAFDNPQQDKLKNLEDTKQEIRSSIVRLQTQITNIEDQISTIHNPEHEKLLKIIKQNNRDKEHFNGELETLKNKIKQKDQILSEKSKKEKQFYNEYKNLFKIRNQLTENIQKSTSKITIENSRIRDFEKRINEVSLKKAKIVAELEGLNLDLEQYSEPKIRRGIAVEQLKSEIQNHERSIKNIGNVNLKALEVYQDIEKEYESLLQKAELLNSEKQDVLDLMSEIEKKKKSIFMKTYKKIAENFRRIFLSLSTKGEAYLDLQNKEDPLSEGLDVKVRLLGTKYLDLKSLSGGEKTLTALAFIFAIQENNPASFYLLDEVDAALDKTNTILLAKLIKKYSQSAQYIIITHNDHMITEADQIYGVSMQKNGISKVISLRI